MGKVLKGLDGFLVQATVEGLVLQAITDLNKKGTFIVTMPEQFMNVVQATVDELIKKQLVGSYEIAHDIGRNTVKLTIIIKGVIYNVQSRRFS